MAPGLTDGEKTNKSKKNYRFTCIHNDPRYFTFFSSKAISYSLFFTNLCLKRNLMYDSVNASEESGTNNGGRKMSRSFACAVLFLLAAPLYARTWTNTQGNTMDAEFVRADGNVVYLKRTDTGKIVTVAKAKLSPPDREFVAYASIDLEEIHALVTEQISLLKRGPHNSSSDKLAAAALLTIWSDWLKVYKTDKDAARIAYQQAAEKSEEIMRNKPIVGYKYNEMLGREITVPIVFGLFTNDDKYYFKVGDGDFSTIAPVTIEQLLELTKAMVKIQNWKDQCRAEKMNVRKEVGRFGGVHLVFVSKNEAQNIYVWMTAKGPWGRDRMVEEQDVRLTPLNISAMLMHISRASELYDEREEAKANAAKLE